MDTDNEKGKSMFHLKRNLPPFERLARLALGLCLAPLSHTFLHAGWMQGAGDAAAAVLACTAVVGFCPACAMFGRKPMAPRT
jgi:hypothetical protein